MIHANLDGAKDGEEVDRTCSTDSSLAGERFSSGVVTGKIPWKISQTTIQQGLKPGICNEGNYNENSCGALFNQNYLITLIGRKSGMKAFLAGRRIMTAEITHIMQTVKTCAVELEELISYWHGQLAFSDQNTESGIRTMINTLNAYNCFMTFIRSRAASFTYCGLRNGYGYRDASTGYPGVIHLAPEMALDKIRFMLS